ncbi:MAG: nucleoside hydrolase-like domain-containing protein [Acidobacteriota bacterium]
MRFLCATLAMVLVACFGAAAAPAPAPQTSPRPRVVVSTDIGGTDYDDYQSMVHLLLYADRFDIEGLISSPYGGGRRDQILKVIDVYERDYPNLHAHSAGYPAPSALRAVTKQGGLESAGLDGFAHSTAGSAWIIERAKRPDPRPLWILVWGGIDDVAQALHDAPSIKSKVRVYFIGGPNKKWSVPAYDYIARHHPDLWMIEANSTYTGWFTGGNQAGDLGNASFVDAHVRGAGALGDFFASGISFRGEVRSAMKMGDTPAVMYVLGDTPDDPTRDSWGGRFVRAWARKRYVFERPPSASDRVETYTVLDLVYRLPTPAAVGVTATLVVDQQDFTGFADRAGAWHFLFSPKEPKTWTYAIRSTDARLDGKTGGFTSTLPEPNQPVAARYPHWWTDDPDPAVAEGANQGARTVSTWREAFLRDFVERLETAAGSKSSLGHPAIRQ